MDPQSRISDRMDADSIFLRKSLFGELKRLPAAGEPGSEVDRHIFAVLGDFELLKGDFFAYHMRTCARPRPIQGPVNTMPRPAQPNLQPKPITTKPPQNEIAMWARQPPQQQPIKLHIPPPPQPRKPLPQENRNGEKNFSTGEISGAMSKSIARKPPPNQRMHQPQHQQIPPSQQQKCNPPPPQSRKERSKENQNDKKEFSLDDILGAMSNPFRESSKGAVKQPKSQHIESIASWARPPPQQRIPPQQQRRIHPSSQQKQSSQKNKDSKEEFSLDNILNAMSNPFRESSKGKVQQPSQLNGNLKQSNGMMARPHQQRPTPYDRPSIQLPQSQHYRNANYRRHNINSSA